MTKIKPRSTLAFSDFLTDLCTPDTPPHWRALAALVDLDYRFPSRSTELDQLMGYLAQNNANPSLFGALEELWPLYVLQRAEV